MTKSKLMFVVNVDWFFLSHRLPIALAAQKAGYEVHIATGITNQRDVLEAHCLTVHPLCLERDGVGVLNALRTILSLQRIVKQVRPDVMHVVTIKPVLLGGLLARWMGVPALVSAVSGLGYVFTTRGLRAWLQRSLLGPLYAWALNHHNQVVIFQNPDDRDQVIGITRLRLGQTRLVRGSGIDLSACLVMPEPKGIPIVAMASRLLHDKGVRVFFEAARILVTRGVVARFWLIGEPDLANPLSVTDEELSAWQQEGIGECFGHRKDVTALYARAHVVTLPSYYGEGLPKSLIEAAACGRAVVTTDMPGCRDAIEPNVSGLLVPARDAEALADALERLIQDRDLRQSMGKAGRALAEREFGIEKVVAAHLQIYQELLDECELR